MLLGDKRVGGIVRDDGSDVMTECLLSRTGINSTYRQVFYYYTLFICNPS